MKKKINEVELSMDADTLNKVRGKLKPTDKIDITDKSTDSSQPKTSSYPTSVPSVTEDIEPQDSATIKYLSNVKDDTGAVSKPFTIDGKNYQMVRAIKPSKEVIMAVFCHDDLNENGENVIHEIDYFEENIANPAKIKSSQELAMTEKIKEEPKKEKSLKLSEFKHFVIDSKTGKVRKFKRAEELAKANMTETESYMNLSQFKKHVDETLFGHKAKKTDVSENDPSIEKPEVKMALDQMLLKMKPYMDKINEPVEKIQFLVRLTQMLQLESSKYPVLMDELKKASDGTFGTKTSQIGENKLITKNELINGMIKDTIIKTIKVKDIK